jgi:hypothetical protein
LAFAVDLLRGPLNTAVFTFRLRHSLAKCLSFSQLKHFLIFLLKLLTRRALGSFFLIFSVSFNSGPRYLVYFIGIFLFLLIRRCVKSLSFIFRISFTEIIVQSREQVNQSYLIIRKFSNRHRILNAYAESFVKAGHSSPFVLRHLCCKPYKLG